MTALEIITLAICTTAVGFMWGCWVSNRAMMREIDKLRDASDIIWRR